MLDVARPNRTRIRTRAVIGLCLMAAVVGAQLLMAPTTQSAGTFTYLALGDTYLSELSRNRNFGARDVLKVDGGQHQRLALIRFRLNEHGATPIASVTLRLHAETDADLGVAVHLVNDRWREKRATFRNRPRAGRLIGHSGALVQDDWVDIDITDAIAATVKHGGAVNLALLHSPLFDDLAGQNRQTRRFASRESGLAPELVVVHASAGARAGTTSTSSPTTTAVRPTTTAPAPTPTPPAPAEPPASEPAHRFIAPGTSGSFEFNGYAPLRDRPVRVWFDAPAGDLRAAKVLVVMHGQSRTAQDYRDAWVSEARRYGALLIVPEFSEALYPGSDAYNLGNVGREPESRWTYSLIEPLVDFVRADVGSRSDGYYLFGHSAGAQFVHRFLLLKPQNRVTRAVSANAGWYTAPEAGVDFPYGLRGGPVSDSGLRSALADSLTVLLGENDTDPNDADLRSTPRPIDKVRTDWPGVSSSSRPAGPRRSRSALPSGGGSRPSRVLPTRTRRWRLPRRGRCSRAEAVSVPPCGPEGYLQPPDVTLARAPVGAGHRAPAAPGWRRTGGAGRARVRCPSGCSAS